MTGVDTWWKRQRILELRESAKNQRVMAERLDRQADVLEAEVRAADIEAINKKEH